MCVIIQREPNVDIEFEKIKSACLVNADGWGYVIPDRGKLEIRHYFDDAGNDPDAVAKLLEEAQDHTVYLHLRFKTSGSLSKKGVHPFPVLTQRKDGQMVQLMHNGTISKFSKTGSDYPDSYHFAQEVVAPLLLRTREYTGKTKVLKDPFVEKCIKEFAGYSSVLTLVDNYGNNMIVNKDQGKQFEGWWASNEYSFNRFHREPAKTKSNVYHMGEYGEEDEWETEYSCYSTDYYKRKSNQKAIEDKTKTSTSAKETKKDPLDHYKELYGQRGLPVNKGVGIEPNFPTERNKFTDVIDIQSLSELNALTWDEMYDFCAMYPEYAALAMMDLLEENYYGL